MNRYTVVFFLLLGISLPAFSQEKDTVYTIQNTDTVRIAPQDTIYRVSRKDFQVGGTGDSAQMGDTAVAEVKVPKSPTRAMMYALVLPGLGQAYNEKYYKIPIVWAALGTAGYFIWSNTSQYKQATLDYLIEPSEINKNRIEGWRRYVEISYIVTIFVYGLQILDAYVDANLYTWDVTENLSMGISPSLQPLLVPTSATGYSGGLTCSFKMKGR